jgi:hypothetical protein
MIAVLTRHADVEHFSTAADFNFIRAFVHHESVGVALVGEFGRFSVMTGLIKNLLSHEFIRRVFSSFLSIFGPSNDAFSYCLRHNFL